MRGAQLTPFFLCLTLPHLLWNKSALQTGEARTTDVRPLQDIWILEKGTQKSKEEVKIPIYTAETLPPLLYVSDLWMDCLCDFFFIISAVGPLLYSCRYSFYEYLLKTADTLGRRHESYQHPGNISSISCWRKQIHCYPDCPSRHSDAVFACVLDRWQLFVDSWSESSKATRQLWAKVKQHGCTLSAIGEERVSLNSTD